MHRVLDDRPIYVVSAARTPVGGFDGILKSQSAPALGAAAIRAALVRAKLDGSCVDEVFMGNVVTGGLGQAPAKQASVAAGIPQTVPATLPRDRVRPRNAPVAPARGPGRRSPPTGLARRRA